MSSAAKKGKGAKRSSKKDPKAAGKGAKRSSKKDPKAAAGKKGKGKKDPKKAKSPKPKVAEESKQQESKPVVVDFGPPVILPETKEYITEIAEMTATKLEDDENVEELEQQFDAFQKLLKERKKACLSSARASVAQQGEETAPICIDIEGMKHLISNIGTRRGELDYAVLRSRQQILDRGRELLAYEAKYAAVKKEREGTSAKAIQQEISDCKKQLGEAEPVLQAAKDALTKITKSSLDEIRALPKPHKLIVKAVAACAVMVGKDESELNGWPNIKKLLKTAFIDSLLQFEARNITAETRAVLEGSNYLAKNDDSIADSDRLTYANVTKANKVAGCLVQWLEAQLKYNEFIPKVEPILAEMEVLKIKLGNVEGVQNKLDTALAELEKRTENAKGQIRDESRAHGRNLQAVRDSN